MAGISKRQDSRNQLVYFANFHGSSRFQIEVNTLLLSEQEPIVIVAPTIRHFTATFDRQLLARKVTSLSLEENIFLNEQNQFCSGAFHSPLDGAIARFMFRRSGEIWEVAFDGKRSTLPGGAGFGHIADLLRSPGVPIEAVKFQTISPEQPSPSLITRGIEMVDKKTITAVRAEAAKITEQIARLPENDWPRKSDLEEKKAALEVYLNGGLNRLGEGRKVGGSAEQARSRVAQAIRRAIAQIRKQDTRLANHLKSSISAGTTVVYNPPVSLDWHF